MYECFHCGHKAVIWDADFAYDEYFPEGNGIIHECHCTKCGAQITYIIREDDEEGVVPNSNTE